ncbi:hypothetical protein BV25DRAFT_1905488 [Artomyces pyxidatus]|uniref:Uncharacterized protein n=1 Tax=Artomyces pyxidatus TaxID=48021 RepID=A0ACB8TFC5_9AGAM|nr:hypothetical protein BV25DRAFT_1905488 [Artomyces pyxidatus]
MAEVVNVIVAFAVIVFIVRWATSSSGETSEEQAAARALRFRPKKVTPEMIDTVSNMFPDIPRENVHYDLLRTGSVEVTSNKVLERGFLDPPSQGFFTLYPRTAAAPNANHYAARPAAAAPAKPRETLISRFHLEPLVESADSKTVVEPEDVGGRAVWEDTAEKREASLRERKAKMVLAARQRLLAQQAAAAAGSSSDKTA